MVDAHGLSSRSGSDVRPKLHARTRVAAVVVALITTSFGASASGSSVGRVALVPNAVAFRTPTIGLAGTGWMACADDRTFGCRPQGTISATDDGGRTWRVVLRTPRPVVSVAYSGSTVQARFDDGETLQSTDGGRRWRISQPLPTPSAPCPPGAALTQANQVVITSGGNEWALCVSQPGAGNQGKSIYRAVGGTWKRLAWTPFPGSGQGHGGISTYGYAEGLAMADDGFGVIWESRGTLWVTRDGGSDWIGLPKVAAPELDFGQSGAVLTHGVGFVLLARGGSMTRRLLETRDFGRTWELRRHWR
jgi:photosystem II stability/assembly factor-like uncharacterized protein